MPGDWFGGWPGGCWACIGIGCFPAASASLLWVRLTDVTRALAQRRYPIPVDVVLEVTDDLIGHNIGRFHLTGDSTSATCERTEATPDLSLSISELSATYLGGRSLAEFAATGRVTEHSPGALLTTTAALTWPTAPTSIEIF